jgi:hypothetical protein
MHRDRESKSNNKTDQFVFKQRLTTNIAKKASVNDVGEI